VKDITRRLLEQFGSMDIESGPWTTDHGITEAEPVVREEAHPEEQTPVLPEGSGRNVGRASDAGSGMEIDVASGTENQKDDQVAHHGSGDTACNMELDVDLPVFQKDTVFPPPRPSTESSELSDDTSGNGDDEDIEMQPDVEMQQDVEPETADEGHQEKEQQPHDPEGKDEVDREEEQDLGLEDVVRAKSKGKGKAHLDKVKGRAIEKEEGWHKSSQGAAKAAATALREKELATALQDEDSLLPHPENKTKKPFVQEKAPRDPSLGAQSIVRCLQGDVSNLSRLQ